MTAASSAAACWPKRALPRRPASTSTPSAATSSSASRLPDRRLISQPPPAVSWSGVDRRLRLLDQPLPPAALGRTGRGLLDRLVLGLRLGDRRCRAAAVAVGRRHRLAAVRRLRGFLLDVGYVRAVAGFVCSAREGRAALVPRRCFAGAFARTVGVVPI